MADVSHELGALRFVVDSSLSSKVAMFNNQATQHKQAQLLNPFSDSEGGRVSPKPTFSKDQYGKPLAGSLTEMRGQKANIHVMKEMVELCQIIDSEGYVVKDEPTMRVIPFGELFNIYNYISDKCVGILLRARKHKLVEFEGEMLFQRRDDDVPIFLLRPILEIRQELESKMQDIKRASSPAPQATSLLMDKSAHQQKLQDAGLVAPTPVKVKSRTPSPSVGKAPPRSPAPVKKASTPAPEIKVQNPEEATKPEEASAKVELIQPEAPKTEPEITLAESKEQIQLLPAAEVVTQEVEVKPEVPQTETATKVEVPQTETTAPIASATQEDNKIDINNNASNEPPLVEVIEASAVYVSNAEEVPAAAIPAIVEHAAV